MCILMILAIRLKDHLLSRLGSARVSAGPARRLPQQVESRGG